MEDTRFKTLQNNSIHGEPLGKHKELTNEEWEKGFHYCQDWDGLFISPDSKEFECCTCHPNRQEIRNKKTNGK